MSRTLDAWLTLARLRRRWRKPSREQWTEDRRAWVRANATGASFADVGGLFSVHGETAFLAEESGAGDVTLLDAGDPTPEFEAERARRTSAVRFVQGDLHDPVTVEALGRHDVVWCTGVLYHSPNPLDQLMRLREVTGRLLYLGTHTIPELPGVPHGCVFYPYLGEGPRRALSRAYWHPEDCWGIGRPFDDRPMYGFANFWWGITPSALRAMLATARFEVVEERRPHPYPWYVEVVARPIDRPPVLPPLAYYRSRQEARERGEPAPPFDTFHDDARGR